MSAATFPKAVAAAVAKTIAFARPLQHRRAGEDAVRRVRKGGGLRALGAPLQGLGLAGQDAVVEAQVDRAHQAGVRRHPVAAVDDEQVARHDLARLDPLLDPVAAHAHDLRQPSVQRLDQTPRPVLLPEAEQRVDADDGEDRPAQLRQPGQEGQRGGRPEQQGQRVADLREEQPQGVRRARRGQLVGAVVTQPAVRLLAAQPFGRRLVPGEQLRRIDGDDVFSRRAGAPAAAPRGA